MRLGHSSSGYANIKNDEHATTWALHSAMDVLVFAPMTPDRVGGVEAVFASIVKGLRARGHAVTALCPGPRLKTPPGDAVWEVPLQPIRTRNRIPMFGPSIKWARGLLDLARVMRRRRPGVVQVHYPVQSSLPFLLLRSVFRYRLVVSVHGSDVMGTNEGLEGSIVTAMLTRADLVTCVSEALARRVAEIAPQARVRVVENGVDLEFWSDGASSQMSTHPPPGNRIVQVGRLARVKGQDVLIRALPLLRRQLPDTTVEFVGGGGDRGALERLADEVGVGSAVTFAGSLPPAEVRARLASADVAVLPSRSEGMPLSLVESMAAGVPMVASAVGGIPDVVGDPPAAELVPPEDPEALSRALFSILSHPDRADDLRARGRIRAATFSLERSLDTYAELFQRLNNEN